MTLFYQIVCFQTYKVFLVWKWNILQNWKTAPAALRNGSWHYIISHFNRINTYDLSSFNSKPSKRLIEKGTIGPPLPETLHRSSLSCTMSDKIFELPDEDNKAADDKHSTQKGASETTQRHLGTQRPPGQYDVVPSKEGSVVSYPEGATANPDRPVVGSMAAQGFFLRELK